MDPSPTDAKKAAILKVCEEYPVAIVQESFHRCGFITRA
jgi:hypothetical protein